MNSWDLALVAAKWVLLVATAGAVGGAWILVLARRLQFANPASLHRYLQRCALAGLVANLLWLLLQIGAVNRAGLGGMFDRTLGAILLQSGVGAAWEARLLGFAGLALFTAKGTAARVPPWALSVLHACMAVLLVSAFGETGHISTLPGTAQLALALHVLAVFLWIGALYPLLQLCRGPEQLPDMMKLQQLMRTFGVQALGIVAVLLIAGTWLATQLVQAPAELLTTPYGRVLLLKLFGVYALLMFAATNKFLLVPRLISGAGAGALRKSIRMEWIVALLVLAVTSWMTTIVGPAGM